MIKASNLCKVYRTQVPKTGRFAAVRTLFSTDWAEKRAVDDISFYVGDGEIVGYIGPNGAGKSTTIKMLSGILVPTSGELAVDGLSPFRQRKEHARRIGVLFGQKTSLWWDVPAIDSFCLLRDMYRVPENRFRENLDTFTEILDLKEILNKPVRQLSLGQRVRADLCAALLHDPKLLFLDEPTIGLDVVSKEKLRAFILEINRTRGVSVIITTHDMHDLEKLANRVIIINHGKLEYDGSIERIRSEHAGQSTLVAEFEHAVEPFELNGARLIKSEDKKLWFTFDRARTPVLELISAITQTGRPVVDISLNEPDIEEIIRDIYEGKEAGAR